MASSVRLCGFMLLLCWESALSAVLMPQLSRAFL